MVSTGVRMRRVADAAALVAATVEWLEAPHEDPFASDVICTPDAGTERWLAQQVSARLGTAAGDGVCAGVEFTSVAALSRRITAGATGWERSEDPWAPAALTWTVLAQVEAQRDSPWLAGLWRHLSPAQAAPGARLATARRIAELFDRYAARAPEMLQAWARGEDVAPDGSPLQDRAAGTYAWQPPLWRSCRDALAAAGAPDPATRVAALTDADLAAGAPDRVLFVAPGPLTRAQSDLLSRVAPFHRWEAILLPPPDPETPLGQRLGARGRRADADWAALADAPAGSGTAAPRALPPAVEVHASHGPDRQVEVLRDVLLRLLRDDPELEPREIVVVCSDPSTYGPLLTGMFGAEPEPGLPASRIRVRPARRGEGASNPLADALLAVLEAASGRATRGGVLELLLSEPVARRFDFTGDRAERLTELVDAVGVRWGLGPDHRARWGLPDLAANTWQAGLDRLIAGVAVPEDELSTIGGVLPYDDVESDAVDLTGSLAEVLSRFEEFWQLCRTPRSPRQWLDACIDLVENSMSPDPVEPWQQTSLVGLLSSLREQADDASTLTSAELRLLLRQALTRSRGRSAFGTGNTVVCEPGELAAVPHRVVCLLGFDADAFPRADLDDGDDLLAGCDPDTGRRAFDRQALYDAVHAATERLVVIYRGHDPYSNEAVPPSIPLAEVLDAVAARASVIHHPLQPFAPANFSAGERSFDVPALRAARALGAGKQTAPPPFDAAAVAAVPPPEAVTLREMWGMLSHPARRFLRLRAGLYDDADTADPWADEVPLGLDHLQQWAVGDRMLGLVLAGHGPEAALTGESLRGTLPVGRLGDETAATVVASVGEIAAAARPLRAGTVEDHDISLEIPVPARGDRPGGTVLLSGMVRTFDGAIVDVGYSKIGPKQRLSGWLRLLALGAAQPGPWRWIGIGRGSRAGFGPVPPTWFGPGIASLVELYVLGLQEPLPLPLRTSEAYARAVLGGRDATDRWFSKRLEKAWQRDDDAAWHRFFPTLDALLATPAQAADSRLYAEPSRFGTLARRVWEPLLRVEQGGG